MDVGPGNFQLHVGVSVATELLLFENGFGVIGVEETEVVPHEFVEKLVNDDEVKGDRVDDVDFIAVELGPNPPFSVNL